LRWTQIIFEIGCGSGEVAYEIALKNPHTGVIATDKYEWTTPVKEGSHYQKVALAWRDKQLKIQSFLPDNLVVLRAETDILRFFPDHCIDSVLMLNPEPTVCEAFLKFISKIHGTKNKTRSQADPGGAVFPRNGCERLQRL
jgi:tRNA G46 methylase TrmB